MADERNIGIYFKVSQEEQIMLQKRMEDFGTKNQSAFIRKMALNGYAVKLDWTSLKELLALLSRTAANVNQIAHRCNTTGSLYEADVLELKQGYQKLTQQMRRVMEDASRMKGL